MTNLNSFRQQFAKGLTAAVVALAVVSPAIAQNAPTDIEAEAEVAPMTKGEKRLAKLLEGRVAGEPVNCIRRLPSQRIQTIDGTAYIYGSGSTIYVQRTRAPDQIDDSDAMVVNRFNASELCRMDVATTVDPVTGIFTGAVFFEDFVPYTRVKDGQSSEG